MRFEFSLALMGLVALSVSACATTWDASNGDGGQDVAVIDEGDAFVHRAGIGVVDGQARGFGTPGKVIVAPGKHIIGITLNPVAGKLLPSNPDEQHNMLVGLSSICRLYLSFDARPGVNYELFFGQSHSDKPGYFSFSAAILDSATKVPATMELGNFYNPPPLTP